MRRFIKKSIFHKLFFSLMALALAFPLLTQADNGPMGGLKKAAVTIFNPIDSSAGTDLGSILGTIVRTTLGLLGVIFIALIIYSGYSWMIAAGDDSKVTKAKDTIRRAIIGLIIVVSSFSFWLFIQNVLFN